jgi:hypothetical protein
MCVVPDISHIQYSSLSYFPWRNTQILQYIKFYHAVISKPLLHCLAHPLSQFKAAMKKVVKNSGAQGIGTVFTGQLKSAEGAAAADAN